MSEHDASQWFIARDGKSTGPISDVEIRAVAAHGYFKPTDLVWRPGFAEWRPALSVFPPQAVPQPPPLPPTPAHEPAAVADPYPQPARTSTHDPAREVHRDFDAGAHVEPAASPEHQNPVSPAQSATPEAPSKPQRPAPERTLSTAGRTAASSLPLDAPAPAPAGAAPFRQAPESLSQRMARAAQPELSRLPTQPPYSPIGAGERTGPATQLPQPQRDFRLEAQPLAPRDPTARPVKPGPAPAAAEAAEAGRARREPQPDVPRKTNWAAFGAIAVTLATIAGGVWIAAYPGIIASLTSAGAKSEASPQSAAASPPVIAAPAPAAEPETGAIDTRWMKTAHWPVIKREFPDWYGERLREAASLEGQNKSSAEINRQIVGELIAFRRQNAASALSASTPKLKVLAGAFLENLRQLRAKSTATCFNFISQGEITPGVFELLDTASDAPTTLQLQVAAIFDAIGDGRRKPVSHAKPQKADYDALMAQLAKLGWTQTDVATFSDPNALARAEPAKVCQMVQDWFVAHIAIPDDATQERLLGETLRPVVSG